MRECRERKGWSVLALSKATGVAQDTIRSAESGQRVLQMHTAITLADHMGVGLDEYIGREVPVREKREATPETVGEHMTLCRIRRGWRLDELAMAAGIHEGTLRTCESGKGGMRLSNLVALADQLGVSLDEYIGRRL